MIRKNENNEEMIMKIMPKIMSPNYLFCLTNNKYSVKYKEKSESYVLFLHCGGPCNIKSVFTFIFRRSDGSDGFLSVFLRLLFLDRRRLDELTAVVLWHGALLAHGAGGSSVRSVLV